MDKMASQYVKDDSGATFIPATQRPDGSWRKPRRVKEGYVPQDEMPLYESKGKQWAKNRPTLPPGLHPDNVAKAQAMKNHVLSSSPPDSSFNSVGDSGFNNSTVSGGPVLQGLSKSAKKNAKRKEKKKEKKSQTQVQNEDSPLTDSLKGMHISNESSTAVDSESAVTTSSNHAAVTETAKRVKNLRKKLREIDALREKIANGSLANPDKDQLEKVKRKEAIENEIEELLLNEN